MLQKGKQFLHHVLLKSKSVIDQNLGCHNQLNDNLITKKQTKRTRCVLADYCKKDLKLLIIKINVIYSNHTCMILQNWETHLAKTLFRFNLKIFQLQLEKFVQCEMFMVSFIDVLVHSFEFDYMSHK